MASLSGKTVIITGGGRGIGREIALGCAKAGASVVVAARSTEELKVTENLIREVGGKVLGVPCDVSHPDEVDRLFQRTQETFGPVFGLVAAAAIHGPIGPFETLDLNGFEEALQVNVMGTVRCAQKAVRSMKENGGGRLIFFSGGGEKAFPSFSAYVAGKGSIWRLTETLASELQDQGIFVNAIAPGAVNTKLLENVLVAGPGKAGEENYRKSVEQKQKGGVSPQKAVDLILYLLSEQSRGLTGKVLSAVWDPYLEFRDLEKLSRSDMFTMRRVTEAKQ